MMKHFMIVLVVFGASSIAGCASTAVNVADKIVGQWQATIGGYPVTVLYTGDTVSVDGASPVSYQLSGDRMHFPEGGSQVRVVSFPSADEMVQSDPMTGAEVHYQRVAAPSSSQ